MGKCYIGMTKYNFKVRKYMHYRDAFFYPNSDNKFYRALRKYDTEMKWTELKTNLSKDLAVKYEEYFIKKFDSYNNGYNSTLGGKGFGRKVSRRVCKLLSDNSIKQFKMKPELRKNMSNVQKLRFQNPVEVEKHRKMLKTKLGTPEARLKNSIRQGGGKEFNVYDFVEKKYVGTYRILSDAAKDLNLMTARISNCLKGKRNHYHTYIFKYVDDKTVINKEYNPIWDLKIKRRPNADIGRKKG